MTGSIHGRLTVCRVPCASDSDVGANWAALCSESCSPPGETHGRGMIRGRGASGGRWLRFQDSGDDVACDEDEDCKVDVADHVGERDGCHEEGSGTRWGVHTTQKPCGMADEG